MSFIVWRTPEAPGRLFCDVRCDGCNTPLRHASAQAGPWPTLAPLDGLTLTMDGGYAQYVDDTGDLAEPYDKVLVLCEACTEELRVTFPGVEAKLSRLAPERCRHLVDVD